MSTGHRARFESEQNDDFRHGACGNLLPGNTCALHGGIRQVMTISGRGRVCAAGESLQGSQTEVSSELTGRAPEQIGP